MYSANLPDFSNTHLALVWPERFIVYTSAQPSARSAGFNHNQYHVGSSALLCRFLRGWLFFFTPILQSRSDRLQSQCNLDFNGLHHLENVWEINKSHLIESHGDWTVSDKASLSRQRTPNARQISLGRKLKSLILILQILKYSFLYLRANWKYSAMCFTFFSDSAKTNRITLSFMIVNFAEIGQRCKTTKSFNLVYRLIGSRVKLPQLKPSGLNWTDC